MSMTAQLNNHTISDVTNMKEITLKTNTSTNLIKLRDFIQLIDCYRALKYCANPMFGVHVYLLSYIQYNAIFHWYGYRLGFWNEARFNLISSLTHLRNEPAVDAYFNRRCKAQGHMKIQGRHWIRGILRERNPYFTVILFNEHIYMP